MKNKTIKRVVTAVIVNTIFLSVILISPEVAMSAPVEHKLDNGVTVLYEKVPGVQIVSVQSWIKTGSVNETPEISGISHFLEHILFKGTKKFKPGEIDSYLDFKGAYNNAFTSTDVTNYYVTIPTAEADAAFEVVSDMVFDALFITDEIEKEKPVVLQEINRKYDDPSYKMWQDYIETLFDGTPYQREVIGTPETVTALNREKLMEYYNKYYHPKNMTLVVVGDIEEKEALRLAKKYFSKTRDVEPGKAYNGSDKMTFEKKETKEFQADVNVEYSVMGFPVGKQDIKTVYANEVLSEILSGGEYSLLNETLRDEKNIVTYASDVDIFNQYHGIFGAFAVTQPGNAEKFKNGTLEIFNDISAGKIDEKRIEKAKNRLKSKKMFEAENVSSLAQDIGFAYVLDFKEYYLNYENGVEAVTAKDVAAAAKQLTSGALYFATTAPKSSSK